MGSLKAAHGDDLRRLTLRVDILFKDGIAACITAFTQFTQQHHRVPHACLHTLVEPFLEGIKFAFSLRTWAIFRLARLCEIVANGSAVEAGQGADPADGQPLPSQCMNVAHIISS